MKNSKGQALIEFVLILPILIIIVMYIIDASKIAIQKNNIENDMNVIVELYNNQKQEELNNYITSNNIEINYQKENSLTTITIKKQANYTTKLIKNILGNKIETKRTVYEVETNEQ